MTDLRLIVQEIADPSSAGSAESGKNCANPTKERGKSTPKQSSNNRWQDRQASLPPAPHAQSTSCELTQNVRELSADNQSIRNGIGECRWLSRPCCPNQPCRDLYRARRPPSGARGDPRIGVRGQAAWGVARDPLSSTSAWSGPTGRRSRGCDCGEGGERQWVSCWPGYGLFRTDGRAARRAATATTFCI